MTSTCEGCHGTGWICEEHPAQVADHDPACHGPAVACPTCQPQTSDERPRLPDGWQSLLEE